MVTGLKLFCSNGLEGMKYAGPLVLSMNVVKCHFSVYPAGFLV